MKITATIIAQDEERNIARAIESLRCCDEILILDSGSTDRTVELATNLGARVIEAGWRGFAGQKNWATEDGHERHGVLGMFDPQGGRQSERDDISLLPDACRTQIR